MITRAIILHIINANLKLYGMFGIYIDRKVCQCIKSRQKKKMVWYSIWQRIKGIRVPVSTLYVPDIIVRIYLQVLRVPVIVTDRLRKEDVCIRVYHHVMEVEGSLEIKFYHRFFAELNNLRKRKICMLHSRLIVKVFYYLKCISE